MTDSQRKPDQLLADLREAHDSASRNSETATDTEAADQAAERVAEPDRMAAIERLVGGVGRAGRAHAEQFLAFTVHSGIPIDEMWMRRDDRGSIRATVLAVPNPGRTALFFASIPGSEGDVQVHSELIGSVCRSLARDGKVDLAQVLLDPDEKLPRAAFTQGGFHPLAELSYLEKPLRSASRRLPELPSGFTIERYQPGQRAELIDILNASYEDTLDCADLRGLRRTEDILAGHEATGAFDPDLWLILREGKAACGTALINRTPASQSCELVYIGLAKAARGRGLGQILLQHALNRVVEAASSRTGPGERAVSLAVDDRNAPALALYRGAGFRRVFRRVALIRALRER